MARHMEADVCIVGGGITGACAAFECAGRGLRVILCERGAVASEASGRNIGGVRAQTRAVSEIELAVEAVRRWERFREELDDDIEYVQGGNLKLLLDEKEVAEARKQQAEEAKRGLETVILTREEVLRRVPAFSPRAAFLGGKVCERDGHANPLKVAPAVAKAAGRLGAKIFPHTPVTRLLSEGGRAAGAETADFEVRAPHVLLCANTWAGELAKTIGLHLPITPKISQVVITEPLPPLFREFITATGIGYTRQALRGNVHLGCPSSPTEDFRKSPTLEAFPYVEKGMGALFPALSGAAVIRAWGGLTAWTPDKIPVMGPVPEVPGLLVAAGFCGHGFCLGPGVGRVLADLVTAGETFIDLAPFRFNRFSEASKT